MNLNFWPKMYYSGGGGGGGSGGGGGGASGGGGAAGGGGAGGAGYGGGAGAGGGTGVGGGAAGEQPPEEPTPVGAFRFNTDSYKLEYYDGNQWVNVTTDSDVLQTDGSRMVLAGGLGASSPHKHMIYADVSTTGTTLDFGDMAAESKTHSMHLEMHQEMTWYHHLRIRFLWEFLLKQFCKKYNPYYSPGVTIFAQGSP